MLTVTLNNSGGELDSRTVRNYAEAAEAVIEMVRECGELREGDTIVVSGSEN